MRRIDLRSDTVTQPTEAMRAARAAAEVGDDVYGEDPTVNRLQDLAARLAGKEAALFLPSGTMGNLVAVKAHTEPGNEAVVERSAHVMLYENGGIAWLSGVLPRALDGRAGILDPDGVAANLFTDVPYYQARTGVVCLENTHNFAGGTIYPLETLAAIAAACRERGVPVHMDGARLFNAAAALGVAPEAICRYADSVMFSVSKALSAPVGSLLAGSRDFIERCLRVRRVVGGGMRQAGMLAAPAIVALETMRDRLTEDHVTARRLATGLCQLNMVDLDPDRVQTNIVIFRLRGDDRPALCRKWIVECRERGVLCSQMAPEVLRLVTHRHIGPGEAEEALGVFTDVARIL